jgi:hypothetical protein
LAAFGIFSEYTAVAAAAADDDDDDDDMDGDRIPRRFRVVTGVDSRWFWTDVLGVMGFGVVVVLVTREMGAGELLPILPPRDGRLWIRLLRGDSLFIGVVVVVLWTTLTVEGSMGVILENELARLGGALLVTTAAVGCLKDEEEEDVTDRKSSCSWWWWWLLLEVGVVMTLPPMDGRLWILVVVVLLVGGRGEASWVFIRQGKGTFSVEESIGLIREKELARLGGVLVTFWLVGGTRGATVGAAGLPP